MFPTFSGHDDLVVVEAVTPMLGHVTPGACPSSSAMPGVEEGWAAAQGPKLCAGPARISCQVAPQHQCAVGCCRRAGDVVICVRPVQPSEHIIKRVVAVAGDEVLLYPNKEHADLRKVQVRARSTPL